MFLCEGNLIHLVLFSSNPMDSSHAFSVEISFISVFTFLVLRRCRDVATGSLPVPLSPSISHLSKYINAIAWPAPDSFCKCVYFGIFFL